MCVLHRYAEGIFNEGIQVDPRTAFAIGNKLQSALASRETGSAAEEARKKTSLVVRKELLETMITFLKQRQGVVRHDFFNVFRQCTHTHPLTTRMDISVIAECFLMDLAVKFSRKVKDLLTVEEKLHVLAEAEQVFGKADTGFDEALENLSSYYLVSEVERQHAPSAK